MRVSDQAHSALQRSGALRLAPGLIDAGAGSLAGFAAAWYATRLLEIDQLGLFSLFFVMFQLVGLVPARLILVPAQVHALDLPIAERTSVMSRSLPLALLVALLSSPLVWTIAPLEPGGARADYLAFGLTTSTMILTSPLQDHCRFMLHLSQRSHTAAMVSGVQLAVTLLALTALHVAGTAPAWVPFLALSIGNASSLTVGLVLARLDARPALRLDHARSYVRSGAFLAPAEFLNIAGLLGAAILVGRLASTEALGSAEAARVAAAPVLVAGVGVGQILRPRIMDAARAGHRDQLALVSRSMVASVVALSAIYLALFGWAHPFNPIEALVPVAFTLTGLVAVRIVAATTFTLVGVPSSVLLAIRADRTLLLATSVGFAAQIVVAAALAPSIEAFALPAAQAAGAIATLAVFIARSPIVRDTIAHARPPRGQSIA